MVMVMQQMEILMVMEQMEISMAMEQMVIPMVMEILLIAREIIRMDPSIKVCEFFF